MATNPMQKKSRNSFILGMIITILIFAIIGAAVFFMVIKPKMEKEKEEEVQLKEVYALNVDVKSGQVITPDLLTKITVYENMIPSDYISNITVGNLRIQDKDGNVVKTSSDGMLYLERDNKKIEVKVNENNGRYYIIYNGGMEELLEAPVVAKIPMSRNTILTSSAVAKGEVIKDDLRYIEYNMLTLGTDVIEGNFVDIRLSLPNGQDLIVVSKKEVKTIFGNTVGFEMTEGEILMMESAIVEAYIMKSSNLYVARYIEPGLQKAALKTYTPTAAATTLINDNPNIKEEAKNALIQRFNAEIRTWIDSDRLTYGTEQQNNLEENVKLQIENAKKAREAYLSGLTSY